jgi:hypothetical protein
MRILPVVAALGVAVALSACTRTYVERERPVPAQPAVVQTMPSGTVVAPGYAPAAPPPAAVIIR